MGFDFDKFGGGESSGNSSGGRTLDGDYGEYDWPPRLYMTPEAIIRGTLQPINVLDGDYGTTIVLNIEDTRVEHGLVFRKEPGQNDSHRKLKLFSFSDFDREAQTGPDFDWDYIPPTKTLNIFGNDHRYVFLGGRITDDDTWETVAEHSKTVEDLEQFVDSYDIDPAAEVEQGTIDIGDARWYFDANDPQKDDQGNDIPGSGGPTAQSKRFVKLLTEGGASNLVSDNQDSRSGWVKTDGLSLKPEHVGRDVRMFMVERPGDNYDYNHLYVQDVETGHMLEVSGSTTEVEMEEQPSVEVSDDTAKILRALADQNDPDTYEQVVQVAIEKDKIPLTEGDLNGHDHGTVAQAMREGAF